MLIAIYIHSPTSYRQLLPSFGGNITIADDLCVTLLKEIDEKAHAIANTLSKEIDEKAHALAN